MATQEEEQAMKALIAAKSLEAARVAVRQYSKLTQPGAPAFLDALMDRVKQQGNIAAYNQLIATRQWLVQIQSGR